MSGKELNFNEMALSDLQTELEKRKKKLLELLQTMKQTDEKLSASLRGETRNAYRERSEVCAQNLQKSIEAFDTLIIQIGQANQAAVGTDKEIGDKMIT